MGQQKRKLRLGPFSSTIVRSHATLCPLAFAAMMPLYTASVIARARGYMPQGPITLSSKVVASKNQVSTELGGEAVILGATAGEYFGLNEVGARVWELVQTETTVSAICEVIHDEYEVSEAECRKDILDLLTELRVKGLIDVTAEAGAP